MKLRKRLILASRSPRRQVLLRQIGLQFDVQESEVPEDLEHPGSPESYVRILSERKARAVASRWEEALVVGADTIVVLDGSFLGKPRTAREASSMLKRLSGRTHMVYTGFTIIDRPSNSSVSAVEATSVTFRALGDREIREYVASGSPMDKAGAYGIQDDYGAVFVERIEGCFYNVVGFPLARFYLVLQKFQEQLGFSEDR